MLFPNQDTEAFGHFADGCSDLQDWKNKDETSNFVTPERIFAIAKPLILIGRHYHIMLGPSISKHVLVMLNTR